MFYHIHLVMFPDMEPQFFGLPCMVSASMSCLGLCLGTKRMSTVPVTTTPEALRAPRKGCKTARSLKFIQEVYLYSWLDAPMVSMGIGRAAQ